MDEERTPLDSKPETFFQDWLDALEEGGKSVTIIDFEDFPDNQDGGGDGGQLITLD